MKQYFSKTALSIILAASTLMASAQRVTMLVTFHVKPDQKAALRQALIEDRNESAKEPGNISIVLFEHRDKPDVMYLFERWTSQAVLDAHFKKPYTLKVLELNKTALTSPMEIMKLNDIAPLPKDQIKYPLAADSPVDLICIFHIKPGASTTFINQFKKSIKNSRPEPGNINFFFHTVPGDTSTYVLMERWRNNAALQSHFQEPYTKELFSMFTRTLPLPAENYLNYVTEIGYPARKAN